MLAGAACEMHPTAILKGVALRKSVRTGLEAATQRACGRGVAHGTLPAIQVR